MAAPGVLLHQPSAERHFFTGMALVMLASVLVGFSRTFFLRPMFPDWPAPSEPIFYLHGAVFTAWMVLLIVQVSLVAGGRIGLHRKLGPAGVVLAIAMVVLGTLGALVGARRSTGFVGIPVPPLQFLAVPIFDMVLFSAFVALAFAQRHKPQSHKRWMLLATVNLLTAAIARWPGVAQLGPPAFFTLTDLFVLALVIWDLRSRGRLHPVTLWGGGAILVSQPLRLVVSSTEGWLGFARWATQLLG